MQQVYINALWLEPPRVFGRRLVPLTLGHAYLLEAIESPVAMRPGVATRQDCIIAAYLCSMPWRRARAVIPRLLSGRGLWRMTVWGAFNRRADWDRECARLMDYVRAYTQTPERNKPKEKKDTTPRIPWPLAVAYSAGARSFADRAWDLPLSETFAFHAAACAYAGDSTLKTEYELALDEQFAAEDEPEAANGES